MCRLWDGGGLTTRPGLQRNRRRPQCRHYCQRSRHNILSTGLGLTTARHHFRVSPAEKRTWPFEMVGSNELIRVHRLQPVCFCPDEGSDKLPRSRHRTESSTVIGNEAFRASDNMMTSVGPVATVGNVHDLMNRADTFSCVLHPSPSFEMIPLCLDA